MPSFEDRFAAIGRSIDRMFERPQRGRKSRRHRSRRTLGERFRDWRERRAERAADRWRGFGEWRRGLDSAGSRRLNLAVMLFLMLLTAGATWMWTRWQSTGLTRAEVQALTTLTREQAKPPPTPAAGPWWNQATTPPK